MQTIGTAREHLEAGRLDQCAAVCRTLLKADPDDTGARALLAECLRAQGRTLADEGLIEEAIDAFGQAVATDPVNADAHAALGRTLAVEGRFDEALAAVADALRLSPADVGFNLDHAAVLLKAGHLLEGWAANEWRHQQPGRGTTSPIPMLPKLKHLGNLSGRTILIRHEDGFGDTIQFLRYAQLLAVTGARIVLNAPRELARLIRCQVDIDEVLTGSADPARYDYHCPIGSLPYVFDTSIETIPADGAYISADATLTAEWAARLPPGPRVGLVWAGASRSGDPAAKALDRRRSLPFRMLLPLTVTPGLSFVSLQTGPARGQIAGGMHDPMGAVKDFADTAAIVANLDAVISVDTAVAHLAGAMGKPVFLLDRYDNCWRWLYGRGDSPWYPTLMIFRQTHPGDWLGPVTQAAQTLEEFFPEG